MRKRFRTEIRSWKDAPNRERTLSARELTSDGPGCRGLLAAKSYAQNGRDARRAQRNALSVPFAVRPFAARSAGAGFRAGEGAGSSAVVQRGGGALTSLRL